MFAFVSFFFYSTKGIYFSVLGKGAVKPGDINYCLPCCIPSFDGSGWALSWRHLFPHLFLFHWWVWFSLEFSLFWGCFLVCVWGGGGTSDLLWREWVIAAYRHDLQFGFSQMSLNRLIGPVVVSWTWCVTLLSSSHSRKAQGGVVRIFLCKAWNCCFKINE